MMESKYFSEIVGTVDSIGDMDKKPECTSYSYIRIVDDSGNVHQLKGIAVFNTVSTYLEKGLKAKFYLTSTANKESNLHTSYVMYALKSENHKVYDSEEVVLYSKRVHKMGVFGLIYAVLTVPLIPLLLGLYFVPAFLKTAYHCLIRMPKRLNNEIFKDVLNADGFSLNA